jgi:hypothetical protein
MATEKRETVSLIGSDKVQGTAVYGADGEKIGSIERVMIEKINGKVSYAVLSFGGFLGIGDDYYPLRGRRSSTTGIWAAIKRWCRSKKLKLRRSTLAKIHWTGTTATALTMSMTIKASFGPEQNPPSAVPGG